MYLSAIIAFLTIVLAVSLDGFTVGVTYGLRKIRIGFSALCVIMCCAFCVVFTVMSFGSLLRQFLSETVASQIGGLIFIMLGIFILYSQWKQKDRNPPSEDANVLTKIIQNPVYADQDFSGVISIHEAIFLGIALALDAFAAGFAASMFGYTPLLTAGLIAIMSGIFLCIGLYLGYMLAKQNWLKRFVLLPPLLLIIIGLITCKQAVI